MRETKPSVCPHDCPGQCALLVTVESGRITDVIYSNLIEVTKHVH